MTLLASTQASSSSRSQACPGRPGSPNWSATIAKVDQMWANGPNRSDETGSLQDEGVWINSRRSGGMGGPGGRVEQSGVLWKDRPLSLSPRASGGRALNLPSAPHPYRKIGPPIAGGGVG